MGKQTPRSQSRVGNFDVVCPGELLCKCFRGHQLLANLLAVSSREYISAVSIDPKIKCIICAVGVHFHTEACMKDNTLLQTTEHGEFQGNKN